MAPAAILFIPAVAILTLSADNVQDQDLSGNDIKWNTDGSICKEREHPANDGIEELMLRYLKRCHATTQKSKSRV
jgi:hypothetical protein